MDAEKVRSVHQGPTVHGYPASRRRLEIYISSTSDDLIDYRRSVINAINKLGYIVRAMEHYGAVDEVPVDKCVRDVQECDVYVLIVAWRYGFIPASYDRSITELEYRAAQRHAKPRLAFLLDERCDWPKEKRDQPDDRIRRFREQVKSERIVAHFTSPEQLASEVICALAKNVTGSHCAAGAGDAKGNDNTSAAGGIQISNVGSINISASGSAAGGEMMLSGDKIGRVLLAGLSSVTDRISSAVQEVILDQLTRQKEAAWASRVEQLLRRIERRLDVSLNSLEPVEKQVVIGSLDNLLTSDAIVSMQRHGENVLAAPNCDNPHAADLFWHQLVKGIEMAESRAVETLAKTILEVKADPQFIVEQRVESIPVSPRLVAILEPGRRECEQANLPYRSVSMLYSLLAIHNSFAEGCINVLGAGIARHVRNSLHAFLTNEQGANEKVRYLPFLWNEHETIRQAKRRAFIDTYPVVNEKYLFLALLESNAKTIANLREYLEGRFGQDAFARIRERAETQHFSVSQFGATPFIKW